MDPIISGLIGSLLAIAIVVVALFVSAYVFYRMVIGSGK